MRTSNPRNFDDALDTLEQRIHDGQPFHAIELELEQWPLEEEYKSVLWFVLHDNEPARTATLHLNATG